MESLPFTRRDIVEVDDGVIHDLELEDKSLHVQAASITDSGEREGAYVEGGSMKDNNTLRQFTNDAFLSLVTYNEHGDNVASSIYSQGYHDTNDNGEASLHENVGTS